MTLAFPVQAFENWRPRSVSGPSTWAAGLVLAALLHAGTLGFLWWKTHDTDETDALGAPAIEIGLDLEAPREEQADLPPGPVAEDSTAAVAAAEQHQKVENEAPKEKPKEDDDPERVVAPDTPKETKQETPKTVESEANKSADSIASEVAAPPKVEIAKEAPKSVAPSPGTGASADLVRMTWQKQLVAHLNRHKRYPSTAMRRAVQVTVAFTLDRLGHVLTSRVSTSSGDAAFDQAALTMLQAANPVPPPPPLIADEGLTFAMPVIFQDKRK